MSETPRTDAEASNGSLCDQCVTANFARQLERELAEATKQCDVLAEAMRRIMKITIPDQNMPYCKNDRIYSIAKESLAAVKGGEA